MTEICDATATGRVMLAHFSEAELTRYERVQPFEAVSFRTFPIGRSFGETPRSAVRSRTGSREAAEWRSSALAFRCIRGRLACVARMRGIRCAAASKANSGIRSCGSAPDGAELSDALTEQERHPWRCVRRGTFQEQVFPRVIGCGENVPVVKTSDFLRRSGVNQVSGQKFSNL